MNRSNIVKSSDPKFPSYNKKKYFQVITAKGVTWSILKEALQWMLNHAVYLIFILHFCTLSQLL